MTQIADKHANNQMLSLPIRKYRQHNVDGQSSSERIHVAYLLKRFPRMSETFILHEMLALESQGVQLHVYSMMNPCEAIVHEDVARLQATVTYVPETTWTGILTMLWALLYRLLVSPRSTIAAIRFVFQKDNVPVNLKHLLRAAWLSSQLEAKNITHLHAHFAHGPAATAQFVSILSAITYSFTAHAKDIYTTPVIRLQERLRSARFVVTCTGFNRDYLSSLVDAATASRIHCLYHGIDLTKFDTIAAPDTTRPPLILAVGRLVEKKGFADLISACAILQKQQTPFRCMIIGNGPLKDTLQQQIQAAGLQDMVELAGPRTQDSLIEIYQGASLVVLPCVVLDNGDRDGIPNVLMEAMSMGIPVVSTAISGIPEVVQDDFNGKLVPEHTPSALADAIHAIVTDADLRAEYGFHGRFLVQQSFSITATTTQLQDLLLIHAHIPKQ